MQLIASKIDGAWLHIPKILEDSRGSFYEVFKQSTLVKNLGFEFIVRQVNQSTSKAGVIRGIHWADNPPGQAKYVSCTYGSIVDVVVDLRVGSPTFGHWDSFELSAENGHSVLISSGLGHAFLAKEESTVTYLCDQPYNPDVERTLNPFDAEVGIDWEVLGKNFQDSKFELSDKDRSARNLGELLASELLPQSEPIQGKEEK